VPKRGVESSPAISRHEILNIPGFFNSCSEFRKTMTTIWSQGSFLLYGLAYFTKSGFEKAAKAKNWEDISKWDLSSKSYLITGIHEFLHHFAKFSTCTIGANSGLGYSASRFFAAQGGTVHMVCRNQERGEKARSQIVFETKNDKVFLHVCDVSKQADIHKTAQEFEKSGIPLDVLVRFVIQS
jgi:dehydrogenase/reductase SDR family protein 12